VIRVYDAAGNVIKTHKHSGDFKAHEQVARLRICKVKAEIVGFPGIPKKFQKYNSLAT